MRLFHSDIQIIVVGASFKIFSHVFLSSLSSPLSQQGASSGPHCGWGKDVADGGAKEGKDIGTIPDPLAHFLPPLSTEETALGCV